MSKFFYLAIFSLFLASCSSNTSTNQSQANQNKSANNSVNIAPNAAVNNSVAATVNQPNANVEPMPNGNMKIQNFAISRDNIPSRKGDRIEKGTTADPIAPDVKPAEYSAPDNSMTTSGMNLKGEPIETRTFQNHPTLLKVERVNLNDKAIKVYLKNGKVLTLPENMAKNYLKASASDILNAVGEK